MSECNHDWDLPAWSEPKCVHCGTRKQDFERIAELVDENTNLHDWIDSYCGQPDQTHILKEFNRRIAALEAAHLKNATQSKPRADMSHMCAWRQQFEAVQERSKAILAQRESEK